MGKKIAVLMGGWASERPVSLVSGKECAKAIRELGHEVIEIDVNRDIANQLNQAKPDLAFNALHGQWGEDGRIQSVLVFSFLPVRQMGFKFAIQADFILNSSREEVLTDRPWNQLLRAGVVEVFSSAVETFKKTEPLALSYLKYIPAEGEVVDPFFRSLRKSIIDKLAGAKCLLSASGDWKKPTELRIAEKSFRTLFPSKIAKDLFGFDYIDSRMQGGNELLRSLGAKEAGQPEVLRVFSAHAAWLQKQPVEWRAKFYAYLANNQQLLVTMGLLNCL